MAAANGNPSFHRAAHHVKPVADADVDEWPSEQTGAAAEFVGHGRKMSGVFFGQNFCEVLAALRKRSKNESANGQKINDDDLAEQKTADGCGVLMRLKCPN